MTRIRFDQFSKLLLEELLSPLGTVERNLEVPGEARFMDAQLQAIVPNILALPPEAYTPLLLQLSRAELISRLQTQPS